ncbi:MAG: lyase family protein [Bacteroidetes bacterium]|nr:lyase family protein [Bacteroidota bacterium]
MVPAVSGGAGTSINMNINEILANLALLKLGENPGNYSRVDPVETANIFQSTNDVVPTSLKVAMMRLLQELEASVNIVRSKTEHLETEYRQALRIGFTQLQEAVPTSFGKLFSTYSEALSRDWWRVSKCFERIKQVNLGGGAIGTGIGIPRFYIMEVVQELQRITQLPLTRSENLPDATSNLDSYVEVHAILKAHAVNLEKMVSDLRLLGSDLVSSGEVSLPGKQVGSTIMPGKVNPVIPEYVVSVAHKVYANDMLITSLCGQGALELNAYLPLIGHALIESLKLLVSAGNTLSDNLFDGLKVHTEKGKDRLFRSPSVTTALSPYIGYHKAAEIAMLMKEHALDVFEANEKLGFIDDKKIIEILLPENLLKMGYTLDDIAGNKEEKG